MAQKAKKEVEKIEKPSIAVKEKKSPGERRELTDDQKKKKGEVELLMLSNSDCYVSKWFRNKTGSSGQLCVCPCSTGPREGKVPLA